jgi:hypothetical protein
MLSAKVVKMFSRNVLIVQLICHGALGLGSTAMAISSDDHHLDHARSCYPVLDEVKFGGSSRIKSRDSEVKLTGKNDIAHLYPNESLENVDSLDDTPAAEERRLFFASPQSRALETDYHTFVHVTREHIGSEHFKMETITEAPKARPAIGLRKFAPKVLTPNQIKWSDGTSITHVLHSPLGDKSLSLMASKPEIQNGAPVFLPVIYNHKATSTKRLAYPLKWPRHLVRPLPNDLTVEDFFAVSQNTVAYFNRSTHTFQIWNIHDGEVLLAQTESYLQRLTLEYYDDIRSLHFRGVALSPSGRKAVLIAKQYAFIFDFQSGRVDFVHTKSEFKTPSSSGPRIHDYFDEKENHLALETESEIYLIDLFQTGRMKKLPKKEIYGFYPSSGITQFAQSGAVLIYMNDDVPWQAFDVKSGKALKIGTPKK